MASSPLPIIDPQINPPGTTPETHINPSAAINPSAPIQQIDPLAQNARPSIQASFNPYMPFRVTQGWVTPGANFPYYAPIHHVSRPIPSIPFPNLLGTPITNTLDLNTVTQTLNQPPTNKEAMIQNIQTQMLLMQQ